MFINKNEVYLRARTSALKAVLDSVESSNEI